MVRLSSLFATAAPSTKVVGIDIGSSAIKVVEVEDRSGILTLTTYGELQLGPYADAEIGQSVLLDQKQEQTALVDVIRESAVKAKSGVFAMPLASSFVTNVTVTAAADADISALVRVEARKVIPASLSEITLDWAEISAPTAQAAVPTERSVIIAAIQNAALTRFRVLMQFAGLTEPPTEIECFSAIRALYAEQEKNVAIIDVGAQSSKLYIAHQGMLSRMHRVRAGGAIATKRIAGLLEVSFEEAEERKRVAGPGQTDYQDIVRAHHSSYERPFQEFAQVIREYERTTGESIALAHMSGSAASFPGLRQELENALKIPVKSAHPFAKVAYPAFMEDTIIAIGPTFTVALGAALRAFE